MILPPKLIDGATIGVVGPASPMLEERLNRGVDYLQKQGYRVKLGKSVGKAYGYLAGSDLERADDINSMFADSEVAAIFCTRGGYGTPRLLELIDYEQIRLKPKIFVGYSDITALQLAIYAQTELVTFSGPMVAVEMGKGIESFTETHFWPLLKGDFTQLKLKAKAFERVESTASGILLGGNLSLITSLVGTPYLPDLTGNLLVVEDVGEQPYQIDRKLMQLKNAGILNKLSGLILGDFTTCKPDSSNQSLSIHQILADLRRSIQIPTLVDLPYGHIDVKYTLPLGIPARLNGRTGNLEINGRLVA